MPRGGVREFGCARPLPDSDQCKVHTRQRCAVPEGNTQMDFPNGITPQQVASSISSRRLELTILPTEKCNFRCTYCYEDFEIGRMKPYIVEGVNNLIAARANGLKELSINWFGGEPLLALSVIRSIATHAKESSDANSFAFSGGLTTNAYLLTPEVLTELVELRQQFFQITLDGWGQAHDMTRKRADGQGTFEVIWANLCSAARTDLSFRFQLRIHVTNENHDSLRELCRNIHEHFGSDKRFGINVQDVRNMGGENGKAIRDVPAVSFRTIARELESLAKTGRYSPPSQQDTLALPARPIGESASSRDGYALTDAPYICYASKPNHLLIRANGRVGKCTVALSDTRNDLGHINPDGTITVDQDKARKWAKGFETFDLHDLACPISTMHKYAPKETKEIPVALA